jgi:hypothetical protein
MQQALLEERDTMKFVHVTPKGNSGGYYISASHEKLVLLDEILRVLFEVHCNPEGTNPKGKSEALMDILKEAAQEELAAKSILRQYVEADGGPPLFYLTNGK